MSSNIQLKFWMRSHPTFVGVFPVDRVPSSDKPFCYIANSESHNLPGRHWIAVNIDGNGIVRIFDPLALPLPANLCRTLANNYVTLYHVTSASQNLSSNLCGHHCMYFLFNGEPALNDIVVRTWFRNKNFR